MYGVQINHVVHLNGTLAANAQGVIPTWSKQGATLLEACAVGGNANAAETSGIPVKRMVVLSHSISGLLAATAGMLWSAQLGSAQPMIGQSWMLPSFAIPIIGGVALAGGSVSLRGTVLAAFLIAIINNALVHLQVDPYYVQFLVGLLILAAVGLNRLAQRQPGGKKGGMA